MGLYSIVKNSSYSQTNASTQRNECSTYCIYEDHTKIFRKIKNRI